MSLKEQVAIVTGAGRGIGKGVALALPRAQAQVALGDTNRDGPTGQKRKFEPRMAARELTCWTSPGDWRRTSLSTM